MIISIIGLGHVGQELVPLLLGGVDNTTLNLMDIRDLSSGKLLDYQHAATVNSNQISVDNKDQLKVSDIVILTAGKGVDKESRDALAQINKDLIDDIFKDLDFEIKTRFIVITNPTETISYYLQKHYPENLIISTGTFLDTVRLQFLLSEHFKTSPKNVKALVLGEHGKYMIPIFSYCTIDNKSLPHLSDKASITITEQLKHSAQKIKFTEKATQFGIAMCTYKLIMALCGKIILNTPVSVRVTTYYKQKLKIDKDIFMSLPCSIGNGIYSLNELSDLTIKEWNALKEAASFIQETIDNIN